MQRCRRTHGFTAGIFSLVIVGILLAPARARAQGQEEMNRFARLMESLSAPYNVLQLVYNRPISMATMGPGTYWQLVVELGSGDYAVGMSNGLVNTDAFGPLEAGGRAKYPWPRTKPSAAFPRGEPIPKPLTVRALNGHGDVMSMMRLKHPEGRFIAGGVRVNQNGTAIIQHVSGANPVEWMEDISTRELLPKYARIFDRYARRIFRGRPLYSSLDNPAVIRQLPVWERFSMSPLPEAEAMAKPPVGAFGASLRPSAGGFAFGMALQLAFHVGTGGELDVPTVAMMGANALAGSTPAGQLIIAAGMGVGLGIDIAGAAYAGYIANDAEVFKDTLLDSPYAGPMVKQQIRLTKQARAYDEEVARSHARYGKRWYDWILEPLGQMAANGTNPLSP
jgi:hypothetical protein